MFGYAYLRKITELNDVREVWVTRRVNIWFSRMSASGLGCLPE